MRRLFIIILLVLTAIVVGYPFLENSDGYVLVAVAGYTIEMSFLLAMFLNIVFFVVLYFCFSVARIFLRTRRSVVGWASDRRRKRGLNRTTQGLIAFVEGRWDYARKSLAKAAGSSSTPLVNYLFAARASSAVGDAKAVDGFLKQAELSTEGADVAIGLTQAELQLQNKQYEQALATLLRVKKQVHNHPVALSLLARVYSELNDWSSLLKLLPVLRHGAMPEKDITDLERYACCNLLVKARKEQGVDELLNRWKHLSSSARKRSDIVICYAEQLIACAELDLAENVLRTQLNHDYDTQLVEAYGRTLSNKPEKQLAFAEKLLKANPADPVLLIALARISSNMNMVERAKEYYEKSIALNKQSSAYAELAKIYAAQGNYKRSAELYEQGALSKSHPARQIAVVK